MNNLVLIDITSEIDPIQENYRIMDGGWMPNKPDHIRSLGLTPIEYYGGTLIKRGEIDGVPVLFYETTAQKDNSNVLIAGMLRFCSAKMDVYVLMNEKMMTAEPEFLMKFIQEVSIDALAKIRRKG